jgi:hypothetical protein
MMGGEYNTPTHDRGNKFILNLYRKTSKHAEYHPVEGKFMYKYILQI